MKDPLPLGLQWMIDIEGDAFRGREALLSRREKGLERKVIGVVTESMDDALAPGDIIKHGDDTIATLVAAAPSPILGTRIGLALFDLDYAFAGLNFSTGDGVPVRTVSMPPFTAKSLTVRLDEM